MVLLRTSGWVIQFLWWVQQVHYVMQLVTSFSFILMSSCHDWCIAVRTRYLRLSILLLVPQLSNDSICSSVYPIINAILVERVRARGYLYLSSLREGLHTNRARLVVLLLKELLLPRAGIAVLCLRQLKMTLLKGFRHRIWENIILKVLIHSLNKLFFYQREISFIHLPLRLILRLSIFFLNFI